MNATNVRAKAAQCVIILSAAAGATILLLGPIEGRLERAQRVLETAQREASEIGDPAARIEEAEKRLERTRERLAWINERSEASGASAAVYGKLMSLAEEHDVRLDRMKPSEQRSEEGIASHGYSFSVSGKYEDVARFVGAVNTDVGFSETVSVRMTPNWSQDRALVEAALKTEHFAFWPEKAEAMAQVGEEADPS